MLRDTCGQYPGVSSSLFPWMFLPAGGGSRLAQARRTGRTPGVTASQCHAPPARPVGERPVPVTLVHQEASRG